VLQAVELKPGGEEETVTIHNVEDYIERTIGMPQTFFFFSVFCPTT
jgi:hypothetical protein